MSTKRLSGFVHLASLRKCGVIFSIFTCSNKEYFSISRDISLSTYKFSLDSNLVIVSRLGLSPFFSVASALRSSVNALSFSFFIKVW